MKKSGEAAIERLKITLCCKNCKELAKVLNVSLKELSETRKSGRLPAALRNKNLEKGINPLWVETGIGKRRVRDCSACERLLLNMAVVAPSHHGRQKAAA
ncbi:helix-turn-helix domain containing protein [Desulfovibrio sp. OttesenSCG-928-C06]|nr:helix-turn-helix domain containing protein [Desulfovibrio sp. OttesenSCG-928-C06]